MSGSAAAPGLLSLLCHTTYTGHTYTGHTTYTGHSTHRRAPEAFRRWAFNCTTCNEILSKCKANQCASVLFANSIAAGRFGVFGCCLLLLCSCLSIYCQATFYVSSFVVLTLLKSPNPGPHCHQPVTLSPAFKVAETLASSVSSVVRLCWIVVISNMCPRASKCSVAPSSHDLSSLRTGSTSPLTKNAATHQTQAFTSPLQHRSCSLSSERLRLLGRQGVRMV